MSFLLRFIPGVRLLAPWLPILALLGLASCSTTKYLGPDEYLLRENKVKIEGKVRNKGNLSYQLSTLAKQQPNSRLFFIPREWFYLTASDPEDTTSFDRWKRRALGEPPAIYRDSLTRETVENMQHFLQYKGYFNAEVFADDETRGRRVYVTYYANPGDQFLIDSVFFTSEDPGIDSLLQVAAETSLLREGRGLDLQLFEQEKERITQFLRNQGYAYFYSNYFDQMEVDTSQNPKRANLYIEVLAPSADSLHQAFRIGRVNIYSNYDPLATNDGLRDSLINGYRFFFRQEVPLVKPDAVLNGVFLQPGQLFRQEDFDKTNKQLGALGIYRFVRIKQQVDTLRPNLLHFDILLTPNYRMEAGIDFDINYTNRSGTSGAGNLIGFSLSPTFRNRNLFRGAELLATNLSAGVEVNPNVSGQRFWNTVDLRAEASLYLPRFVDYLNGYEFLNRLPPGRRNLFDDEFFNALRENTATRFSVAYEYLLILDWYSYNLFNARYGYDFQKSTTTRYLINHVGIDLLLPTTFPRFQRLLRTNTFLERSFGQQAFISLLFRDLDYLRNSRVNRRGQSYYANARVELAGAEIYAVNSLVNRFSDKDREWKLGDTTEIAQYAVFETDFRYFHQFEPRRSVAFRFNVGLGRPFGYTSDVPYVKQFYVGGPSSIRAFPPRGVGPGGYLDSISLDRDSAFRLYQTGDIKLEMNLEYRFDLLWRLKGAFFIDAGNVWTYERDTSRNGSQLLFSKQVYNTNGDAFTHYPFWKQLAIGGGFGLRFDLTYFIFRLDLAVPLRYNYPREREDGAAPSEGDWWNTFSGFGLRDVVLNLGLGYPF